MMGFAALLAYISQWEKVNQAYTVSLSLVFLNVPKTLRAEQKTDGQAAVKASEILPQVYDGEPDSAKQKTPAQDK